MTTSPDRDGHTAAGNARLPRALVLLRKLLATQACDLDAVAEAIVVKRSALDSYLSGSVTIPLERQLCLALFVVEHVPSLARLGHQLRAQVAATMAFQAGHTATHLEPPPPARF
jgi:hypothetical protein